VARFLGFPLNPNQETQIMTQDWLTMLTQSRTQSESHSHNHPQAKVRVILLGTPSVNRIIYKLYQRDFAEVGAWSPPQSIPDSDEIIRVHIHRFGRSGFPT
jgi:hypothetical protein